MTQLILGDSLEKLKELADNSVDSIVTDPPYGLSTANFPNQIRDFTWRSFNIIFPQFKEFDTKSIKYSDFISILRNSPILNRQEVIGCIEPWVSMPESSINLNSNIEVRNEEINNADKSTCDTISDSVLVNEINVEGSQYIGNYVLDFGTDIDFSSSNISSCDFGEFSLSSFCMPISSICASFLPNELIDFRFPFFADRIDNFVGLADNSFSQTDGRTFVLTGSGAIDSLVLRFDMTGISLKRSTTITTEQRDFTHKFICPKLIRTFSTTSDLSSKLESIRVSFIGNTANGTRSFYHFDLYLPINYLANMQKKARSAKGFMGKKWDYDVPNVALWRECLRVLKPGGHMLVACGTRTQHRMAINIEDANFEIRDIVAWIHSQGFPKSLDISKQLEKLGEKEVAEKYDGYGTSLKPAIELWTLARKPLSEKNVAQNVLKHGVGGINIDGCRVTREEGDVSMGGFGRAGIGYSGDDGKGVEWQESTKARFPANLTLECTCDELLEGENETFVRNRTDGARVFENNGEDTGYTTDEVITNKTVIHTDPNCPCYALDQQNKGASRFFYCAKASKSEKNRGLDAFPKKQKIFNGQSDKPSEEMKDVEKRFTTQPTANHHPTVKAQALMQYLVRLITPKGGIVLDPFMGSGSTGVAAISEGCDFIGIEREEEYFSIAKARIKHTENTDKIK